MIRKISSDSGIDLNVVEQVHGFWRCEPIQYICCDNEGNKYLLIVSVNNLQKYLIQKEIAIYEKHHLEVKMIKILFHGNVQYGRYILYKLPFNFKRIKINNYQSINLSNSICLQSNEILDNWLEIYPKEIREEITQSVIWRQGDSSLKSDQKYFCKIAFRNINDAIMDCNTGEKQIFASDHIYVIDDAEKEAIQRRIFDYLNQVNYQMNFVDVQKKQKSEINVYPNIHFNKPSIIKGKCIIHYEVYEWNNVTHIEVEITGIKAIIYGFLMPISYLGITKLVKSIFRHYPVLYVEYENILYGLGAKSHNQQALIYLPDDVQQLRERNSSKSRYNIKREKRLIEQEIGKYTIESYKGTKIPDNIIEKYFEYKRISHGRDFGVTPSEYIEEHFVSDVYVMRENEHILAICLSCENDFPNVYFENFSYDNKWKHLSVGSVMYDIYLEKLIEKKVKVVFLGNGQYEYKKKYGSRYIDCYSGKKYRFRILDNINILCRKCIACIDKLNRRKIL